MRSNISNNLNSIDLFSISNRDLSPNSSMKVSQRLDSRLKSVLPQLKGKKSQIYLTIKAHSSFQDSKIDLIKKIKQQLQVPNQTTDTNLNNYISWQTFKQTKSLLKQQYLDNQLYYIIVPEKYLSWAQTFAKQQRADSDNKKKIHVLAILKETLYLDKKKNQQKKRFDKIPDYVHYYNIDNTQESCKNIVLLINQHLQQKLKHQDDHIKSWALSNKYAEKNVKRRTIHIYYDKANQQALQKMYKHYNPKARSSWIQIHSYESFTDIIHNIRARQLDLKQSQKMTQQITSRIIQSKSQLQFNSMKSLAAFDNSQLLSTTVQSVAKLNKDDINIIIARTDFKQLDKLKAFIKAQKIKNWDLIQINKDSTQFYGKIAEIFKQGKNYEKQYELEKQRKILNSKTLYIIGQITDQYTKSLYQSQDNVFHNMEFLVYQNANDFALLLRQSVKNKDNYTIGVVPGGINSADYQFQKQIQLFKKQYRNTQVIQNVTIILSANGHHTRIIPLNENLQNLNISQLSVIDANIQTFLQTTMAKRDNFFHPFKGLKGSNVYILVKITKQYLLNEIRDYISHSKRLHLATYIDKQYLTKQLQTIQIKDSAIIITDDSCLREAQQVLINFDQAFIMNITNRKNLKEQIKVFAWGQKKDIYQFLRLIPELDQKFQDENYIQNPISNKKQSLQRKNRFIPKNISFIPGNTVVVRLPADLTDEQSRKMQVRLKKYFKQQIKFQYYKQPADIRLRIKQIQPLTFNIHRDKQVQYMKGFAKKQIQQKRQQFILYTENPSKYKQLIEKPEFQRFRFLSNRWYQIEDYIIRTYNVYVKPQVQQTIFQDQLIHVFVDKLPCQFSQLIQSQIDMNQLKAPNNTRFYLKSQMEEINLMYPPNHKYYYVIEQDLTENEVNQKKNAAQNAFKIFKQIDPKKKLEFIQLGVNRGSFKNTTFQIKSIQANQKEAVQWVSQIKVLKIDYLNSRPYILIDKSCQDWYYFLNKYSQFGKFRFFFTKNKQNLRSTIQKIRNIQPFQEIWIMAKNSSDANQYIKIAQKVQSGRNISIIGHGAQNMKNSNKKILFSHRDRLQVQKFILNPFRRSLYDFFPSSVNNKKVILAPVNCKNRIFESIPLNQKQISNWIKQLNAQIINCSDFRNLQILQLQNQDATIYAIIDASIQQTNRKKLQTMTNVKRIILNMTQKYNTRQLKNNFKESNKQIYEAAYPAEITNYLKYLRYNIKNSQVQIQKNYPKELTQIYYLKSTKINDQKTLKYILMRNDSIVKYQSFELNNLNQALEKASTHDYNAIFIGDNSVGLAVSERNRRNNTKFKFINSSELALSQGIMNNNVQLSTNQLDQVKMFMYNLPEKRYNKAKNHNGKFKFVYDLNNTNSQFLDIVSQIQKVSLRNSIIEITGYKGPNSLNTNMIQPCFLLIQAKDQPYYQNLLKGNNQVQYLIINNDIQRNLASYGNKFFINKNKKQYVHFFNNLRDAHGSIIQPLPLNLDKNIAKILRSLQNLNSQSLNDQKYFKLTLNPPFIEQKKVIQLIKQPIKISVNNLLDKNPSSLLNIPNATPSQPTLPLGIKWIEKIKQNKINTNTLKPLMAPALDIMPPTPKQLNFISQPQKGVPTLKALPLCPKPPIKRFHLAILFAQNDQFKNLGQMMKSNLQPQQYTVKLISFRNQHQLDQYSKGNASRLSTYDKIIVFLTPQYKKYEHILKAMKSKMDPRMQYFIFDDNFYLHNHKILANHLKPYKIGKINIPFQNQNLPYFWNDSKNFNIFVPYGNRKYDSLKNENIQIIPYNNKQTIQNNLHQHGYFNVIVCDKNNYHKYKQFCKISPRCILLVQDLADLYQDEFYFYRYPNYSIYYGPNGVDYLRKNIKINPNPSQTKILHYFKNDGDIAHVYQNYQKVESKNYNDVLQNILKKYKMPTQYGHWILKNGPIPQPVAISPKVYMQQKDYMKDFKNNYLQTGYKHNNDNVNLLRSQLNLPEYSDLQQVYYKDHKHLMNLLQNQISPCIVLINGSNNRILGVRQKFNGKHNFISLVNDNQRWIDRDGYLLQLQNYILRKKQDLFLTIFNQKIFDAFNDFQYYYLSNKAQQDHKKNIYFRTKQDLQQIYQNNPNLLMVVFVQKVDQKHIPQIILEQYNKGGRVKIIFLATEFQDDDTDLYIKFNQIDPVIMHINRVEMSGRKDYIIFKDVDGDKKRRAIIMQRHLENVQSKPYYSFDDIQQIAEEIKGQYKKIHVICYPYQQQDIQKIFNKYSIKNKKNTNQQVQYFYIQQASTIHGVISNIKHSKIYQHSKIKQNYNTHNNEINNLLLTSQSKKQLKNKSSPNKYQRKVQQKNEYDSNVSSDVISYQNNFQDKLKDSQQKYITFNDIRKFKQNKDLSIFINEKLKEKCPIDRLVSQNQKLYFFKDYNFVKNNTKENPSLIISNEKYNQLQDLATHNLKTMAVYVSPNKQDFIKKNKKAPNTLIIDQAQVKSFIQLLQDSDIDGYLNQNSRKNSTLDQYDKIRIVYDDAMSSEQKRKLLSVYYKNSKILPTKFKNTQKLNEYLNQSNTLIMVMLDKQPSGLDKINNKNSKNKKTKMIFSQKKANQGFDQLQTIFEQENDNDIFMKVKKLTDDQVDLYLSLSQRHSDPDDIFDMQRSKLSNKKDQINQQDQITKLNVHSNIRVQDIKLFRNDQIQKIKQRLDGNLIVLVIQHSKKDQVKQITNKYNVLVQHYTNSVNLENDLRDRKDSVTIAVINKKMIDKVIPLKQKFKQVTFILQCDTPQQELLQAYKPYISGQIRKMSDLQKIIAQLYSQNQRIRYNQHNMKLASRFDNKRPSISVVDFNNNQKFSNALNNQVSKKVYLFYRDPQNTHVKLRLMNQVGQLVTFVPYKSINNLKKTLEKYNSYSSIIIVNGQEIQQIQQFISKRKQGVFIIRFNPSQDLRDFPKVKKLFSTYKKADLEDYLLTQFMKIGNMSSYQRMDSRYISPSQKNVEVKKYTQKYQPNTFGTTPRFSSDFVPPKSMKQTYSHKYMKSTSKSKIGNKDQQMKSKNIYYQ